MILRIGNKQSIGCRGERIGIGYRIAKSYSLYAQKGLTLVEVLLAVAILALGIVGVLKGYERAITTLEAGQYNIDTVNLLKQKAAEVMAMIREKEEIVPEKEQGSFESPFQDFSWEWDLQPSEEEGLYALSLTVSSEYNPRRLSLKTYVAGKRIEKDEE